MGDQPLGDLHGGEAPRCKCGRPIRMVQSYYASGGRYFLSAMLVWEHLDTRKVRCFGYPNEEEATPREP